MGSMHLLAFEVTNSKTFTNFYQGREINDLDLVAGGVLHIFSLEFRGCYVDCPAKIVIGLAWFADLLGRALGINAIVLTHLFCR